MILPVLKKLKRYINNAYFYQKFIEKLNRIYINRKHKVTLYRFLEIFIAHVNKNNLGERAGGMAFSFLLSMFPAIVFIFTIIPYIPIPNLTNTVLFSLKTLLPLSVYNGVATAIYDITHIPRGGLISIGFAFAIFSATNGIMAMISAFNRCYRTLETRGYVKRLRIALSIVFLLLIIAFVSIFIAIITRHLLNQLPLNDYFLYYLVMTTKYLFLFGVFFFTISVIYYLAPAVTNRWRLFSIGSFISSTLIVLFTLVFSYYLNSFDSYNKLYGSLGALIGVMLWIYGISMMLLLGFEINASIDLAKKEGIKINS